MSGKVLVVLLVGTGIWFTIKLRGVQFVQFGKSLKAVFGSINLSGAKAGKDGYVLLPGADYRDCRAGRYPVTWPVQPPRW